MSTQYPVHLEKDDNETILVTFPDYPGATYGHDEEEALGRAIDCLETYFIGCMEERKVIPSPSQVGKKQLCCAGVPRVHLRLSLIRIDRVSCIFPL